MGFEYSKSLELERVYTGFVTWEIASGEAEISLQQKQRNSKKFLKEVGNLRINRQGSHDIWNSPRKLHGGGTWVRKCRRYNGPF